MLTLKKSFILSYSIFSFSFIFSVHDVPTVQDFKIVSIKTLLKKYGKSIDYAKFKDATPFHFDKFPYSKFFLIQPYKGTFAETFVLTIPDGRVCSYAGYVIVDEKYMIRELNDQILWLDKVFNLINEATPTFKNVKKISGKVAVVARQHAENYAHFLVDTLGRLAILESMGIDYDYLYIPYEKPYTNKPHIKEFLTLWGIDPSKIIEPCDEFYYIEADELVVPSYSNKITATPNEPFHSVTMLCSVIFPTWLIEYLRYKFLPLVSHKQNQSNFSKKIYISRQDMITTRRTINEDEVFKLLEAQGFKRYMLGTMSVLEQIELFSNADVVIGTHGAGLANILFCRPNTKVIEIFQARSDSSFYCLSQSLNLDYIPVKTMDFPDNDMFGVASTVIPLEIIQNIINNLNKSN